MALLSVADALARVLDGVTMTEPETLPLLEAHGRVLASDLVARFTQPPFDASAMDGYAVRREDLATLPITLTLVGDAAAGQGFPGLVGPNEAVRISTGASVPEGANAIVLQENSIREGHWVVVQKSATKTSHIRPRAGDFAAGDILLHAGLRLNARALTLAAAMGHAVVPVRRHPRVALLATGDELVPPDATPGPDQIIASTSFGLAAMIQAAGAAPRLLGIARDTRESLKTKMTEAQDAELLITTGGASVGDHDLVAPVLRDLGMDIEFSKIAMRPGKPLFFGRLGARLVLGLPGNPASALVSARLFVVPLIHKMLGRAIGSPDHRTARLARDLPANGDRAHYMRAVSHEGPEGLRVSVFADQDSSLMTPLALANCLVVRAPHAPAAREGESVSVLEWNDG